jgi:hypothetical protein
LVATVGGGGDFKACNCKAAIGLEGRSTGLLHSRRYRWVHARTHARTPFAVRRK